MKKKYFGTYMGTIPAYKMDTGDEVVEISSSTIYVQINKEDIVINIGKNELHGTYMVMFAAKTYYLLDINIDDQLANERILVYKRGRRLSRDGMYPQPVTELKKYKN
ncbi:MAG: hypothetical protein QNK23_15545 [Crocinitomicaceae bacterium]|nr:hypothetical protein [Crocinitomicaceae bacterium]